MSESLQGQAEGDRIGRLSAKLQCWMVCTALPLWSKEGLDFSRGGFFESLATDGLLQSVSPAGAARRGRVVARQIYVFDAGRRLGWRPEDNLDPVRHGCDYLFFRMHAGGGLFHTSVDARNGTPQAPFSLYEYAFYLFALARALPTQGASFPIETTALQCLTQLRARWGRALGGFEESNPPSLPLKSNPHMHMLEAALAWLEATSPPASAPWQALAQELVDLCLNRFIDPASGALREFFDAAWKPMAGDSGRIVEPGHQFEWAWLLMLWARTAHCRPEQREPCLATARRLVDIGESHGVDPARGVAVNELWDDFSPKDAAAKLWPQTERLKAWCAMLENAPTPHETRLACEKILAAAQALQGYFLNEPAGLWQEVMLPDGSFTQEPCKASSFYHIVCAIETLHHCVDRMAAAGPGAGLQPS